MSAPIRVGDLVIVARACCARSERWAGLIFIAHPPNKHFRRITNCCGYDTGPCAFAEDGNGEPNNWAAWFLKRIPPLEELEREQDEAKEPA